MANDISHNRPNGAHGFFSFDAVVAVVILLSMVSLTSFILQSVEDSADSLTIAEKQMRMLVLSDILIRRELATSNNQNVYSNLLDIGSIQSIPVGSNYSTYAVSDISLNLVGTNTDLFSHRSIGIGNETYCIHRIVVVKGVGPAVLWVCGS